MPDSIVTTPDPTTADLSLILGPEDSVVYAAPCAPPAKGGRYARASIHVVVHRSHGLWTHVYRVLQEHRPDRMLVHLDKVFEGDRAVEARGWALARRDRG